MLEHNNLIWNNTLAIRENSNNDSRVSVDTENSLARGNLFPNLYIGYKNYPVYNLNPKTEQERLLYEIYRCTFICIDINLYLDVNPNDYSAIEFYNYHKKMLDKYTKEYNKRYQVITHNDEMDINKPWVWLDSPWPWEGDK